jgi:tetratricopeptide (TPR) repeat protein
LRLDVGLELDFAEVQPTSQQAVLVAEAAADRAGQEGDAAGEAVARVVAALRRLDAGEGEVEELERLAHTALLLLERVGDHRGLAWVWNALGYGVANMRGRFEDCARAAERALEEWRLAGVPPTDTGGFLGMALIMGPRPADEALEALDATLSETPHPNPLVGRAWLLGMLGRLDEAEALAARARERSVELTGEYGVTDWATAEIAVLAGDHERAARHLERQCKFLEDVGQQAQLSTFAPRLGLELCELGRFDEAEQLALKGRDLGDEHDAYTQTLWRQVLARVHSHRGDHGEAERIAHEAVAIADESDSPICQAAARDDLACVLAEAGRPEEAATALRQALARYERKGVIPAMERTRVRLAESQT